MHESKYSKLPGHSWVGVSVRDVSRQLQVAPVVFVGSVLVFKRSVRSVGALKPVKRRFTHHGTCMKLHNVKKSCSHTMTICDNKPELFVRTTIFYMPLCLD